MLPGIAGIAGFSSDAAGGGGGGGHQYWRVFISSSNSGSSTSVAEVEFHTSVGGSDVASGGTAIASTTGGGTASNAFDNNTATTWNPGATSSIWIGYDFGVGNEKNVVEYAIIAPNDASIDSAPKTFKLQWSDDGSTWTDASGSLGATNTVADWILAQTRTFPETLASGFHRYWRLMCKTQNGGSSQFRINEIEFRATSGGADQCVNVGDGGNATTGRILRTSGDGGAFGNAFDNTFDDFWYGAGATDRFIGQVFLSPIKVEEISVQCANQTTSNTPATAEIQYSDDGVTWTNQKSLTFSAWVTNTAQVLAAI